ncbi:MAG: glycoside hydrolase family 65 protein [Phycisphaerales bacterium]|nr:glycoside hydrolase family 65 protein [Phycisphaerales bacterium]
MAYDTWKVVNTSAQPHTLGQWNSVATISNGYLGLKGNVGEQRDGYSAVTLIHGVFDELDMFSQIRASNQERRYLDARYFDTAGKSPAVANLPNPLFVQIFVGEREVSFGRGEVLNFEQSLDLRTGVYRYGYDFRDGHGRTTRIAMERFACLRHAHRVFVRHTVTPLDHAAPIRIRSGITGRTHSNTTGERQFKVREVWTSPAETCRLVAQTPAREHEVKMAVAHVLRAGTLVEPAVGIIEHDTVYSYFICNSERGQPITLERQVILACSEDLRHGIVADVDHELRCAAAEGYDLALAEQRLAWEELWRRCDVEIEGDDPAQLGLRFCLFHLLQAAPRFTDRLSVPVKLLTGEYYQGTTFYDTDVYIVPFYTYTLPEIARTCLNFRYEGLRHGREIARALGYEGAKLAWQAGPHGEECLGPWWRFTHTNIHINCDAAYTLMQYLRVTGDQRYLAERGIDLLVETARFFAARAVPNATTGRYDLHDVAGPDEGHCESTNNFYTNVLAIRNLRAAADMLEHLQTIDPAAHAAALRRLAVGAAEPEKWRTVAEGLTLLFDPRTHVYEQCEGFYQLKPIPPDLLEDRKVWFVTVFPYQALNQPDVVMALVMLRDDFPAEVHRANWQFYKDKSMNFSSMSFVLNAIMAADVGDLESAYRDFVISAGMDLDENLTGRKDTYAGLHGTAAGGAWMAAVFGFGGVCHSAQGLRITPNLPQPWTALRFHLVLHDTPVHVAIDRQQVTLTAAAEPKLELPIVVAGKQVLLESGKAVTVRYRD